MSEELTSKGTGLEQRLLPLFCQSISHPIFIENIMFYGTYINFFGTSGNSIVFAENGARIQLHDAVRYAIF